MPDRIVSVRLTGNNSDYDRAILASAAKTRAFAREAQAADRSVFSFGNTAGGSTRELDRFSGRLGLLRDTALSLGPALVPIGAVGIPAVTGLASALGFTAIGAGTAIMAFQGVGDALKALNKAHLEPTEANLNAADLAMQKLGPDAQNLARYLSTLTDEWAELRDAAASGIAPGVIEALDQLLTRGPQAVRILEKVSDAVGEMIADGGASLASDRWDDFFDFIETEAPAALTALGHSVGNLTHGLAELWMAFDPLNDDVLSWLTNASRRFDEWASHLSETDGFKEFVAYIEANGPEVGELLATIAMAILHIAEAAAPVGAVTLPILEQLAEIISALADSDLGTPILGVLALSRGMALLGRTVQTGPVRSVRTLTGDFKTMGTTSVVAWGRSTEETLKYNAAASRTRATMLGLGKTAAVVGGLAFATSDLADKTGLSNTALFASAGLMAGPWGAAAGGAAGLLLDLTQGNKDTAAAADEVAGTLDQQTGAVTRNTEAWMAKKAVDDGVLDDAESLGLNLADVTQAMLGNEEAVNRVTDALSGYGAAVQSVGTGRGAAVSGWNDDAAAAQRLRDAIAANNGVLDAAQGKVKQTAAALDGAADSADGTASAVDRLNDALVGLNNFLTGRQQIRDWEQAWLDLSDAVKENGQNWDKTTRGGIDNLNKLDATVDRTVDRVDTLREKGRDLAAQDFVNKQIDQLKVFRDANPAAREEVQRLIDKLKEAAGIDVKPKVTIDSQAALDNLAKVKRALDDLDGKTAHMYVTTFHNDVRVGGGNAPGGGYQFTGRTYGGVGTTGAGLLPPKYGGFGPTPLNVPSFPGMLALAGFGPMLAQGKDQVRSELQELREALKEAGGVWTKAMQEQAKKILHIAARYDKLSEQLKKNQDALADLEAQESAYAQQVAGLFNTNPFDKGLAFFDQTTAGNTSSSSLWQQTLQQLAQMGLDGPLFEQLAASGNMVLATQLIASGRLGIAQREQAFAAMLAAQQSSGAYAGGQVYDAREAALQATIDRQTAALERQMAAFDRQVDKLSNKVDRLGQNVEDGSERGTYKGMTRAVSGVGRRTRGGGR